MNTSTEENTVQWLFLDLNAFFESREQQENSALRGRSVIVVQTPADSAVAIAASYAAKGFGIKTGTLVRDARRLRPAVIPVRAQSTRRLRSGIGTGGSSVVTRPSQNCVLL
jgi:DNA polymerase-4